MLAEPSLNVDCQQFDNMKCIEGANVKNIA